jgi:hypothetical protein
VALDPTKKIYVKNSSKRLAMKNFLLFNVDDRVCGRFLVCYTFTNVITLAKTKVLVVD